MTKRIVFTVITAVTVAVTGWGKASPRRDEALTPAHADEPAVAIVAATQAAPEVGCMVKDVRVELALFGSGTHLADVTDRVVKLLRSEPGGFLARADSLGVDPMTGKNKSLLIRYRYKEQERIFMVTGGNRASYTALTESAPVD